jgi:multiple sugar transport system permease protein
MAGSVLATLPVLIAFLVFQRYIVRGIALSGLK